MTGPILVYGGYGHTGRLVVAELLRRGWTSVVAGRDPRALADLQATGVATRVATVEQPGALAECASGTLAVVNCAGPFGVTAPPLIEAALRASIPYLDVTGEPEVVAAVFERFSRAAADRGVPVMPAAAFFGALGDLLGSAALGDRGAADAIDVAYALSEWRPTRGTRRALEAMGGRRLVFRGGRQSIVTTPPPVVNWAFPPPTGQRPVIGEYPGPEAVLLPRHTDVRDVNVYMTAEAVRELRDPAIGGPVATGGHGRSGQTFTVHARAVRGGQRCGVLARGRDIYATSAQIAVACLERLLGGGAPQAGVLAPRAIFGTVYGAADILDWLAGLGMTVTLPGDDQPVRAAGGSR